MLHVLGMSYKKRLHVTLSPLQWEAIETISQRLGVQKPEAVRYAVDQFLRKEGAKRRADSFSSKEHLHAAE